MELRSPRLLRPLRPVVPLLSSSLRAHSPSEDEDELEEVDEDEDDRDRGLRLFQGISKHKFTLLFPCVLKRNTS